MPSAHQQPRQAARPLHAHQPGRRGPLGGERCRHRNGTRTGPCLSGHECGLRALLGHPLRQQGQRRHRAAMGLPRHHRVAEHARECTRHLRPRATDHHTRQPVPERQRQQHHSTSQPDSLLGQRLTTVDPGERWYPCLPTQKCRQRPVHEQQGGHQELRQPHRSGSLRQQHPHAMALPASMPWGKAAPPEALVARL